MKCKTIDQLRSTELFHGIEFGVKFLSKFAIRIFVVPNPHWILPFWQSGNQRPMHTNIHTINAANMKPIIQQSHYLIRKIDIVLLSILRVHQNIHSRHGNTVVLKGYSNIHFSWTNCNARHLCTLSFRHVPFLY